MNELVVFCPNPDSPNELWEIRSPDDARVAPAAANASSWAAELNDLKHSDRVQRVVLTNLLRVAQLGGVAGPDGGGGGRGVLRFESTLRPSETEWAQFLGGSRSWGDLSWVQGIHGTQSGLRQTWCRFEFQLRPADTGDDKREAAIPFFGSAAVMYEMRKP
jgi:hypothetical protein